MGWPGRVWRRLVASVFGVRLPVGIVLPLVKGERITAVGRDVSDQIVVTTTHSLWLADSGTVTRHLPWHLIHKAAWKADSTVDSADHQGTLTLVPGYEVAPGIAADGESVRIRLSDPGEVPAQVRSRVTRSVAYSTHHQFPDGGGVWIIARRIAGQDGLSWVARYDGGVDLADPTVQARTAQLLIQERELVDAPD